MKRLIDGLVDLQIRRPWWPIAFVALVTVFFGFFASKLQLRTQYEALLPSSQPSVIELHKLQKRTSVSQTALILLEGDDRGALRRMGDALVPELVALGPEVVSRAEAGPKDARRFLAPRAGLFLSREKLEELARDVDARWDYEVARESGALLDEDAPAPPPFTAESLKARLEGGAGGGLEDRFPDGYYERKDGRALIVVARSPVAGGDLPRVDAALSRIRATVQRVKASSPAFAPIRVSYAGDMPTGFQQYGEVLSDLLGVGAAGLSLVLAVVLLYFLRARAVLVMGITILVGLVWTFGLTAIVIGQLNIATAFLVSVVAGNGINVGILYQARYFEERGRGAPPVVALRTAVRATWKPTVIAAVAAAASYGSLLSTDFRAFHDFGFIAGSGMLLCWVVKTLLVPPLLVLLDRPARQAPPPAWRRRFEMAYGKVFAWLVPKAPRAILAAGLLVAVSGCVAGVLYAARDPMEYDMRKLENDSGSAAATELHRAWSVCNDVLGGSQGPMIVAADTAEDARELSGVLRARWDAAPAGAKPFVAVHSLWDFVPGDQAAKIPTLLALGARLERARARGFVSDEDWAKVQDVLPPQDLAPFGLADLPPSVAEPFTERSGTRGTLALIEASPAASDDLRDIVRYADSYRETTLPSGKVVRGSGSAVIFADMLGSVVHDVPRAIALSLAFTFAAVLATFRRRGPLLAVAFALWVGVAGVALFLFVAGIKVSFLNFAALPITFGIGVDYAINVVQRHDADGGGDVLAALRTSGGAVVLCSLTTMLGYLALLGSHNEAIRSLGAIAAAGEISCLLAAVVVLPALWLTLERRGSPVPELGGAPRASMS